MLFNKIALYLHSCGSSYFFSEIRELLACGFTENGFNIEFGNEKAGFLKEVDWHVIIAPCEFFFDFEKGIFRKKEIPKNVILLIVEQPHSYWFDCCEQLFKEAYAIWSIDYSTYCLIKRNYNNAAFLPLGYSEKSSLCREICLLPDNDSTCFLDSKIKNYSYLQHEWEERPIDITIFCQLTKRRNTFFAKNSYLFSRYNCYFVFVNFNNGYVIGNPNMSFNTETVCGIMQRSKVLINIHRGSFDYFEWHRIVMHGIWNKTLVVSEDSNESPPFHEGKDYIACELDEMGEKISFFLSPFGICAARDIVSSSYRTLITKCRIGEYLKKNINMLVMGE